MLGALVMNLDSWMFARTGLVVRTNMPVSLRTVLDTGSAKLAVQP